MTVSFPVFELLSRELSIKIIASEMYWAIYVGRTGIIVSHVVYFDVHNNQIWNQPGFWTETRSHSRYLK